LLPAGELPTTVDRVEYEPGNRTCDTARPDVYLWHSSSIDLKWNRDKDIFWERFPLKSAFSPCREDGSSLAATAQRSPLPTSAGLCPARNAVPENHSEVDRNFFFHPVPSLHAALWQSRSEPVKGVRWRSINAQEQRALDRTRLASARRKDMKRGTQRKKFG